MYTTNTLKAKKILIETESRETFTLRIRGKNTIRIYCGQCQAFEEMIDLNAAADISGVHARELLRRLESGSLHSPESTNGHLLICRGSLESEINDDPRLRRQFDAIGDGRSGMDLCPDEQESHANSRWEKG
jgi:hypothetical protein